MRNEALAECNEVKRSISGFIFIMQFCISGVAMSSCLYERVTEATKRIQEIN